MFLDEIGIGRVAKVEAMDFNDTADHTIFSNGTLKNFIPTLMLIHSPSANMTSAVFSAGKSDAKTDFVATITCSGMTGSTKCLRVVPDYNATPAAGSGLMTIIPPGGSFVIDMLTAAGIACTATVELFGYFIS